MKKIILLISFFLLTGCYDYIEINDLAFVSTIGIDYINDNFNLSYEILNYNNNTSKNENIKSYVVNASGKTIAKAFDNITLKITDIPYYYHLKSIIISEEIATNYMPNLIDYITRNPEIRNEFFLVIIKNDTSQNILNMVMDEDIIIGDKIEKLIETNDKEYNTSYNKPFEDILEKILNPYIDAQTSTIVKNNNEIKLDGIGIFKDYKYVMSLKEDESAILNILNKEYNNYLLEKKYDDKNLAIKITNSNINYKFSNHKIIFDIKLKTEIKENLPNFNLKDSKTYDTLNKDFSNIFKNKVSNLLLNLKNNDVDPLGIKYNYYKQNRININNLLKIYDYEINVNTIIDKKGLIFEVGNE